MEMETKAKVAPEIALKQFLYLSNEIGYNVFMTGNPETHHNYEAPSLPFIKEFLKSESPSKLLEIIENATALPYRDTMFYVLAQVTVSETTPGFKQQVYKTVLQLIKDDKDLFDYIKFVTKLNKPFSKGINKLISRHYLRKEPKQLVRDFGIQSGYHGWTHKDLIKLAHIKSNNIFTNTVMAYVVKGPQHGRTIAQGDKEALAAIEYLDKCKAYRRCTDDEAAAIMLEEINFDIIYPPERLQKPLKVWNKLLDHIDLKHLIRNLVKLHKLNLLKDFSKKVVENLTNTDKICKSGLQPIDIFYGLKYFENGGKSMHPDLESYLVNLLDKKKSALKPLSLKLNSPISCPPISNALNQTVDLSCCNVPKTGKRFLINIALEQSSISLLKNIDALEAAAILTLPFVAVEDGVIVTEQFKSKCSAFKADFSSFGKAAADFKAAASKRKACNSPDQVHAFDYAMENKKPVDVFVHISGRPIEKPSAVTEGLIKYKKEMSLPSTKLVLLNVNGTARTNFEASVLSIQGFNTNIPRIINAFVKDLF